MEETSQDRPELFEEIKSRNRHDTVMGTTFQGMNLWEFENFTEMEKHQRNSI